MVCGGREGVVCGGREGVVCGGREGVVCGGREGVVCGGREGVVCGGREGVVCGGREGVRIHVLMRDEMKERSEQGQTNNNAKQHSTPKAVTFPKKNELPRVATTLYTLHSRHVQMYMYMYDGDGKK